MKGKNKMNKRYLITGVSGVDPYTNIYLVPQIITEKIIDDGSKIEIKYKNNKDTKIPQEVKLDDGLTRAVAAIDDWIENDDFMNTMNRFN